MTTLIVVIHIVACLAVIVLVLLQSGKEGMGVIFGGGSQSVFGSTGAGGLLVKLTALFGAIFLITSLTYNIFSSGERRHTAKSIMLDSGAAPQAPAGAASEAPAAKPEEGKKPVTFEEVPAKAPEAKAPQAGAEKPAEKPAEGGGAKQ